MNMRSLLLAILILAFKAALDANAGTNEIHVYEGVRHAFEDPLGDKYAPEETTNAWDKRLALLSNYV